MARFLVDESLPRAVTRALVAGGHDTIDVRDVGLRGASDAAIASRAAAENRIVISADLDVGNALRFAPGTHPGTVISRLPPSWDPETVASRRVAAVASTGEDALDGTITIVEAGRIRIFSPSGQCHPILRSPALPHARHSGCFVSRTRCVARQPLAAVGDRSKAVIVGRIASGGEPA